MAARNNKSKSSGLRMLWIPGGRKGHPKGRFDSTSKQISYSTKQKKSEVWSLGGSKAQKDILTADPNTALLDGPTSSGLVPLTCTISVVDASAQCASPSGNQENNLSDINTANPHQIPHPTVPLESTETNITTMPSKSAVTMTITTAEIIDENRFSILAPKETSQEFDIYDLPAPPTEDRTNMLLNTSSGTTRSTASPPKTDNDENKDYAQSKKKLPKRNHNNNHPQEDINSIESISDNNLKPLNTDFAWIDDLYREQNGKATLPKSKNKKKKKRSTTKEMDQLDGVPSKPTTSEPSTDEDEKVIKCLYYTLMCCDCTIS